MEVISGFSQSVKKYPRPVIAIGIFDGLHRGHLRVIQRVVRKARRIDGTAVVMTFWPHPLHVLKPSLRVPLIASFPYRLKLLEGAGIDVCWVIRFTRRFGEMSPTDFIERLVKKMLPSAVVIGDDFRFGRHRAGTIGLFKKKGEAFGFSVTALTTKSHGRKNISSTLIRQHVLEGDLRRAAQLLGRPFSILGRVVRGESRGRKLGFPTANIYVRDQLFPLTGVYVVSVLFDGRTWPGMANVGRRPSFCRGSQVRIEVNIFGFDGDLYGKEILVRFYKKIRDEIKFSDPQLLAARIAADKDASCRWFKNHPLSS